MLAVTRTLDKTIYFGVVLSKVSIIAKENDIKEVKFVRKWGGGDIHLLRPCIIFLGFILTFDFPYNSVDTRLKF